MEKDKDQENVSFRDFIYYDFQRIGSFISQIDEFGEIKETNVNFSSEKSRSTMPPEVDAKVSVGVVSTSAKLEKNQYERSVSKARFDSFDPHWRKANQFLDLIEAENFVQRDLNNTRTGQFLYARGTLEIMNMEFIKSILSQNSLVDALIGEATGNTAEKKIIRKNMKTVMEIVKLMPFGISARIFGDIKTVWGSLRPDFLTIPIDDIPLHYGSTVHGSWGMIGITGAVSHRFGETQDSSSSSESDPDYLQVINRELANAARQMIGRKDAEVGVTPLLIFRELSRANHIA